MRTLHELPPFRDRWSYPYLERGELSRWLVQPLPGVFLGSPSKRVRDELWAKACKKIGTGGVTQLWTARGEPGYAYRQAGTLARALTDFDGIALVTTFKPPREAAAAAPG